jgi:hypothetical protein
MSVCAVPMCSHQSFDGSSYYVDVDVDIGTQDVKGHDLQNRLELKEGLGMWCLTSFLTKFQLYCGGQFLDNLYHIILYQVHLV